MTEAVVLNDDYFSNDRGSIRLRKVQHHYGYDRKNKIQEKPLSLADLNDLTDLYKTWRDTDEIVPIKYVYQDHEYRYLGDDAHNYINWVNRMTGSLYREYNGFVVVPKEVYEWRFPKAVKRGNDLYIRIVKERLAPLIEQEPIVFFDRDWGVKKTNMLYATLTTDLKHAGNDLGYLSFGKRWNRFITNIRNQYNGAVCVRSWQSQEKGLCHVHALIYFPNHEFTAVCWRDNDGYESFRLPSRSKDRKAIKSAWKWGFCDIVCVDNTQEAFKDLLKYVTRDLEGGESDLTNTMVWYFQRQSFAISRDFAKVVWGGEACIGLAEPTNADLIYANECNSNSAPIRIEIYPTIRRDLFSNPVQCTLGNWDKPPPLTENDVHLLDHLVSDYALIECSRSKVFDCPVFMYRRRM